MPIHVIACLFPRPEHRAAVVAELHKLVQATRAEPGNLRYDLFEPVDDAPGLYLYETYADEAALAAHRASEHYRGYRSRVAEWTARPTEVAVLRALDVASD